MLAVMGVATGVDAARLVALRAALAEWLRGERLFGALARAGLPNFCRRDDGRSRHR